VNQCIKTIIHFTRPGETCVTARAVVSARAAAADFGHRGRGHLFQHGHGDVVETLYIDAGDAGLVPAESFFSRNAARLTRVGRVLLVDFDLAKALFPPLFTRDPWRTG
jgi:hypothetical protein